MEFNNAIKNKLSIHDIDKNDGLTYLLSIYFNLNPSFIPEKLKKQINFTDIIERDYSTNTIKWNIPLFDGETIEDNNWGWVLSDYRKKFYNVDRTKTGSSKSCILKMQKLFSLNPDIRKDEVLEATDLYLEDFITGRKSTQYLQNADYFIYKIIRGGGLTSYSSKLMQYIELLRNVEAENKQRNFNIM